MVTIQLVAPWTEAGPYRIINCAVNAQQTATNLKDLLNTLQTVIDDASLSTASPAFIAFFKDVANRGFVLDVLRNITTGAPISTSPTSEGIVTEEDTIPLICSTGPGQIRFQQVTEGEVSAADIEDPYLTCTGGGAGSLYFTDPQPFIVLCPGLFKRAPTPPLSKSNCLRVELHFNRFRDEGKWLYDYQMWALFYALLQANIKVQNFIEDVKECFRLSASEAVQNEMNWIYYAASKRFY